MKSLGSAFIIGLSGFAVFAQTAPSVGVQRLQTAKSSYVVEVLPVVPRDLQGLFEKSAIVARVHITSSSAVIVDRPGKLGPSARTKHTADVIAIYKGVGQPRTIEFYQTAGTAENDRYSVRIADQTVLVSGREYIIFLAPYAYLKSYSLVGEDNGAFEIADSKIRPVGTAPVSRAHDNMTVDRFVDEVRAIHGRGVE